MSAPAASSSTQVASRRPTAGRGPTFGRVLASEWTKLTSLRSSYLLGAVAVVVSGALTYLSANASSVDPGFDPLGSLTSGLVLAPLGLMILGVLVGTGEFSTGTFRSTFTAVPRRLPVLAAQVVATAGFALVTALVAVGAAVLGIVPAASSRGLAVDLTGDGTPLVLAGMTLYLVGMALFGLAVGALLRHSARAVVTAIAVTLVLPIVLMLATDLSTDPMAPVESGPPPAAAVVNTIVTLLPSGAGSLLTTPDIGAVEGAPDLGPWGGGAVLGAWILVPLAGAAVRLRTRDAT
ncbi:ABC transporter permease [Occultella aeris]|uniref:ABC-2 family transporter protein n=1 Tax=Occultella aeris TaxID=2761496 RepID=A0A7M4DGD5_9MICO|nr:ABC transporter permease subunit [Occultella aeris]VZO35978.1 ABC-2 family transporter protein [Occultella aeris]